MVKIAIDGPAGAGKSTISKIVAEQLGFEYIDTGAMYRAITLKALRLNIDLEDESQYDFLKDTLISVEKGAILLDGEDVSEAIRSVEVTENVSTPSKIKCVRDWLVEFQRQISRHNNVVMDGRDIAAVVLPNANYKIYLDATPECRALRRQKERALNGVEKSFEETLDEIVTRDFKDSSRAISPLKKVEDAIIIDTSSLTIDHVVNTIIDLVNERSSKKMSEIKYYEGSEVRGTITKVTNDAITIITKDELKAVIYNNDLIDYTEGQKLNQIYFEGGEFKGLVKQISKDQKTGEILYILSTKLYKALERLPYFELLKENDEIIQAKVVKTTKFGADLIYKDYPEFKLFLPIRAIDLNENALQNLKGQLIDVIVTKVDASRLQIIVSNTAAMGKKRAQAKADAIAKLEEGMVVEGVVENILEFGAIVNIGGVSGLLHRNEISHGIVRNVEDHLSLNQTVNVKIIKLGDGKISLSLKANMEHPWETVKKEYPLDHIFEGVIDKVIPAGLLVKLTDRYNGLMPHSEYSWRTNDRLEGKYNVGNKITVKVLNIENDKKRVLLSHKATKENTWADIKLRKNERIVVEIASIEERGAKVDYKNISGFMPINEVTATKRLSRVDEMYKVGENIEVVVIECDPGRAKLIVSAKIEETRREREQFDNYIKVQEAETPTNTIADMLGEKLAQLKKKA